MLIVCAHCTTTNRVPDARLAEAPTCGQCKEELLPAAPVALDDASFDKVVARTELPVVVDASPRTSARFAIRSIPTLLLMQGGREVKRQAGATQAAQIVAWVGAGG